MGNTYSKPRKDANHAEVVKAFRKLGAYVVDCAALKNAFDLLVIHEGKYYIVEVKDGEKPPSQRRLTQGEVVCKLGVEMAGGEYHLVQSLEDVTTLLNGQ